MKFKITTRIELILNAFDENHAYKIASQHLEEAVENIIYDHVKSAAMDRLEIEKI